MDELPNADSVWLTLCYHFTLVPLTSKMVYPHILLPGVGYRVVYLVLGSVQYWVVYSSGCPTTQQYALSSE